MAKKTVLNGALMTAAGCLIAAAAMSCSRAAPEGSLAGAAARPAEYPSVTPDFLNAAEWRFVGPPRGGRATAVAGDPSDPLVFYFGASHGGVWKTLDAGTNWRNVSDGFFKTAPVGAIDVSLSNPSIVYVGMGESCPRQDVTPGDGVYKSTDGGATWTHVGLTATQHISKIRIHPHNPDIVYVAAVGDHFGKSPERGVYRTKDGGKTWQRVLFKSDLASAFDLSMDMTNPAVLYAALNQFERLMWTETSGGPDSGLYKTTDGGDTWTDITRNPGLPKGVVGRIGVSVSPVRPSRVWAMVEADDGALFRSDDGGKSWQRMQERRAWQRDASSYMHVIADTQDADTVYVQSYQFMRSTDAGVTFDSISVPHGDHHALWIDPKNSKRMIEGNDGGATVSLNGGASWSTLHNQPTSALFSLAVDNRSPYWLYAAQNDNSHIAVPSQTTGAAIAATDTVALPGGEGGQTAVKPDGSVVYAGDRTAIERYDVKSGQSPTISVWPENEFGAPVKDVKQRMYYTSPIVLSPHDPGVLYTAGNIVYRSSDEGFSWEAISGDLTKNRTDKMQGLYGGPITSFTSSLYHINLAQSLAESPLVKGEIWFGADDGTVQVTQDGGTTWANVSPPDLPDWTTISAIDPSPHARGTAYVAGHGYRVSNRTPYLYKTTDYGKTWQRITQGIRENDFARVIREDPVRPGLLYAGTETGVYVSFNDGELWQSLQRNLPVVPAQYMLVKGDDLVVATHGRGFWIMDNLNALRQITPEVTSAAAYLFEVPVTERYLPVRALSPRRPIRPGIQLTGTSGEVAFIDQQSSGGRVTRTYLNAGANPSSGTIIEYYFKQAPSSEVTLAMFDAKGQEIQRFSSHAQDERWLPADAGVNRFVWDLRYPNARQLPVDPRLTGPGDSARASAPIAPPGQYRARLTANGQTYEQPFEIRRHPNVAATHADLQEQFTFMTEIRDRLSEVTDIVTAARAARTAIEVRALSGGPAATIKEQLDSLEGRLIRVVGSHPHMVPPKGPEFKLAALSGVVGSADAKPTHQMRAVFEKLSGEVARERQRLDRLQGQIKTLN